MGDHGRDRGTLGGLLPPQRRDGLGQAVERIKSGEAGAVLTAWRSMISSVPQEYDEIAREIEKAGGFLHVKALTHSVQDAARESAAVIEKGAAR